MACSSSKDTNPQVLAGTIARNIFTAFFSDDRWQNSFVSIFMGSWDDFKNGVVSVPEPTSAEKAQHKKRRAMKPPSVSWSRSPSPPSPSCDRAFVIQITCAARRGNEVWNTDCRLAPAIFSVMRLDSSLSDKPRSQQLFNNEARLARINGLADPYEGSS